VRTLALFLLLAVPASAQGFFHGVAHHVKGVFVDMKHDKEWRTMVVLFVAASATDTVTTCRGFNRGYYESNPIYGGTNSCAKLVAIGAPLELGVLTLDHWFTAKMRNLCKEDLESTGLDHDLAVKYGHPNACSHSMWITAPEIVVHAWSAHTNECRLNGGCNINIPKEKR